MMNDKNNDVIEIVAQAIYGNRMATEISKNDIDRIVLGYLDNYPIEYPIDRTIINMPNNSDIVFIYNKHKEEEYKELKKEHNSMKPLVVIPEKNIELYSRCIACRMDKNGELVSLNDGDYEKIIKYFME